MDHSSKTTRRDILRKAVCGATFPALVPSGVLAMEGRPGANDRIQVGVIGIGFRANLLIDQLPSPGRVVALSDCVLTRAEQASAKRSAKWDTYQDYRRLLDRKDIDAVIVATQDFDRHSLHSRLPGR